MTISNLRQLWICTISYKILNSVRPERRNGGIFTCFNGNLKLFKVEMTPNSTFYKFRVNLTIFLFLRYILYEIETFNESPSQRNLNESNIIENLFLVRKIYNDYLTKLIRLSINISCHGELLVQVSTSYHAWIIWGMYGIDTTRWLG